MRLGNYVERSSVSDMVDVLRQLGVIECTEKRKEALSRCYLAFLLLLKTIRVSSAVQGSPELFQHVEIFAGFLGR